MRRYRSERGAEPRQVRGGRRVQLRVGAVLTVFAAAILVAQHRLHRQARGRTPVTGPAGLQAAHSEPLTIKATGQQWLWRYDYPNGAFSYYKLVVPVDTTVVLDLVSTDVVHTWDVPDLAGKRDAVPGKHSEVVFRADQEGAYFGQAATFSGQAYGAMRTEVDVVSPEAYKDLHRAPEDRDPGGPGPGRRADPERKRAVSARRPPRAASSTASRSAARAGSSWRPAPTTRTSAAS